MIRTDCLRMLRLLSLLPVLVLSACATTKTPAPDDAQLGKVLSGAGLPHAAFSSLPDPEELLTLSPDMRQFAHEVTRDAGSQYTRMKALAQAFSSPEQLGLRYRADLTLAPNDAFAQRSVNCLSYTMLFVAMAREVGVEARFNQVLIPPIWDFSNEGRYVLYQHVNARVGDSDLRYTVIDVSGENIDSSYEHRRMSDREAMAQFYNNRAFELRTQSPELGLGYLLRALSLEPQQAYLWSNLAEMYLSLGAPKAAAVAVRRAIELDVRHFPAYGTAVAIYETLGDHRQARQYRARAEYFQNQNPYYHYDKAVAALKRTQPREAVAELRRAIDLYPREHRFFYALGIALADLGETGAAQQSIQLALTLTQDDAQAQRYRSKLDRLQAKASPTRLAPRAHLETAAR